jgi:uncharacterized repeat protein (TIGR03803 family)
MESNNILGDSLSRRTRFPFQLGGELMISKFGGKAKLHLRAFISNGLLSLFLLLGLAPLAQSQNSPVNVLFSFFSESTSKQPISMIKARSGHFYGTTIGGELNLGSVFTISGDGAQQTLHFFQGSDGDFPYGRLLQGDDGNFYGTTVYGGATYQRVAFRITPEDVFAILHDFGSDSSDGTHPWGGFVQGRDGNFYGTTFDGGRNGAGTFYRMTPDGSVTILHNFAPTSGYPNGPNLTSGRDGLFYGVTCNFFGANKYGTIFRVSTSGRFKELYRFPAPSSTDSTSGYCPVAPLIQASDGSFFGTTQFGSGVNAAGTVFRMTPSGQVTFLHSFHLPPKGGCQQKVCDDAGNSPTNALVEAPDGFFYSTISGCQNGGDCLYRINRSGEFTSNIYDFTSQEAMSAGNLIPGDGDGLYYSFAQGGGMLEHVSNGDVFSINLELLSKRLGQGWCTTDGGLENCEE